MLETIREFAVERLRESGREDDLRRRHAERMLQIARAAHLSVDEVEAADLGLALVEREDLRAALDWAEERDARLGLELAIELQQLWNASAPKEGFERIQRLLDRAGEIPLELRAGALRVFGGAADLAGHDALAVQSYEEGVELYRQLGDDRGVALVEQMLAVSARRLPGRGGKPRSAETSPGASGGKFRLIETSNYW